MISEEGHLSQRPPSIATPTGSTLNLRPAWPSPVAEAFVGEPGRDPRGDCDNSPASRLCMHTRRAALLRFPKKFSALTTSRLGGADRITAGDLNSSACSPCHSEDWGVRPSIAALQYHLRPFFSQAEATSSRFFSHQLRHSESGLRAASEMYNLRAQWGAHNQTDLF